MEVIDFTGLVLAAAFGLCGGSFINSCAWRVPRGISIIMPRSMCPACGATLAPHELIPVLSYLFQKGACTRCGTKIGVGYPIIEIISGALAAVFFYAHGFSFPFFHAFSLSGVFLAVALVDLRHRIIPNAFVVVGLLSALTLAPQVAGINLEKSVLGALIGGGSFALIRLVYRWLRAREGMGAGDVKLSILIGAALGFEGWLRAVMLGSIGGVLAGLYLIRAGRAKTDSHLPYG
ncbi:MAG: prepilin peptidase, partial [Nitrospinaceae bacterium]|nr:prepilin peptidase [Nitrospinaceae bacterium]